MTKLRFDNLSLKGFSSFKLVEKKRKPRTEANKVLTKLVRGTCIKEGNDYKISVDVRALKPNIIDKGQPDLLILDFTEESYEIKGVTSVFSREPDKHGKYTRYIRNEVHAKFHPGSPERYTPFCRNWVCSGYIVRRDGKLMFEFHECIAPVGYTTMEHDEQD